MTVQLCAEGKTIVKTIESNPTKPFIAMTNTGSQWKEAAGIWFKEECFGGIICYFFICLIFLFYLRYLENNKIPIARLWNYFQRHYLKTTKQTTDKITRPLHMKDFEYLLRAKFKQGVEMKILTEKNFLIFWDWIGPGLKKIRYQKHLLWMFENGYDMTFYFFSRLFIFFAFCTYILDIWHALLPMRKLLSN